VKPQLRMLRTPLEGLPDVELPEPYRIRHYQPGDGLHWTRILAAAFGGEEQKYPFDGMMRGDHAYRPERVLFVVCDDEPVSTASAYPKPGFIPRSSTLHYVAVNPAHQGHRLGYWIGLAALHRMALEGHTGAWLATDDLRFAAIKTYLNLGFQPLLIDENQRARWADVFRELNNPGLCEQFGEILAGPLWVAPVRHRDEFDYPQQVTKRRRHYSGRPVGRPSHGECDAFADESLYKASELGEAGASVAAVEAGADVPFHLWFRVGSAGLSSGASVLFYTPGQRPLGTPLQAHSPEQPGFVEVTSPQDGRVAAMGSGFRVVSARLLPGEEVRLCIGRQAGFRWTPLSGRKEFKVVIDVGHGEPLMRLPEPVVVRVVPCEPDHLDVFLPGSASKGQQLLATVSLRDRFDNRVPRDAGVHISAGESGQVTASLQAGLARVPVMDMASEVRQVTARCTELDGAFASNCCLPVENLGLYFGDLHVHDLTCPAEGYPADVYRWAMEDKRLDFISVAVQNHAHLDNEKWTLNKHMAEAFLDEGSFVTFPAFEWQHSHYGDKVIHYLSGDRPYLPVDDGRYDHPAKLYDALRSTDALIVSHHPGYDLDLHVPGTDWEAVETDVDRLVELWSMHGSSEGVDPEDRPLVGARREDGVMAALHRGLRMGFVAGSDTHSARPGGSAKEPRPYWGGLCALWAEALTRRSLFEALYARRTYALTGARIALKFTVNDAWMGSELPAAHRCVLVAEVWAPAEVAEIQFLKNGEIVHTEEGGRLHVRGEWEDKAPGQAFYHCRVVQSDGHLAVCSPVWVG